MVEPTLVYAQAQSGFGAGYGQPMGQRRQMNRMVMPQSYGGSFVQPQGQYLAPNSSQPGLDFESPALSSMSLTGVGYQVHLLGQVKRPGTYRLPPSTRMAEALTQFAGGLADNGSHRGVELRRNGRQQAYDLFRFYMRGDLSNNPFLLDNDIIYVPFSKVNVQIQGPVKRPDTYELSAREQSVWDVVQLAGGFTVGAAHGSSVVVIRYEGGDKKLLEVATREHDLKAFELRNGDIIIIPHILTANRRFDYNISELPADHVFFPSFNDNVFVMGAVVMPGAYPFSPNYSLRDYVNMAGPDRTAKTGSLRVVNTNGETVAGTRKKGFLLSPGDTIIVPNRSVTADNVIKWYNTVANTIITGFTVRELVRR